MDVVAIDNPLRNVSQRHRLAYPILLEVRILLFHECGLLYFTLLLSMVSDQQQIQYIDDSYVGNTKRRSNKNDDVY